MKSELLFNDHRVNTILLLYLEQLSQSIRNRTDVHFCMYFSLFEWFHPLFLYDQQNNFTTRKYPEVKYLSFLSEILFYFVNKMLYCHYGIQLT